MNKEKNLFTTDISYFSNCTNYSFYKDIPLEGYYMVHGLLMREILISFHIIK